MNLKKKHYSAVKIKTSAPASSCFQWAFAWLDGKAYQDLHGWTWHLNRRQLRGLFGSWQSHTSWDSAETKKTLTSWSTLAILPPRTLPHLWFWIHCPMLPNERSMSIPIVLRFQSQACHIASEETVAERLAFQYEGTETLPEQKCRHLKYSFVCFVVSKRIDVAYGEHTLTMPVWSLNWIVWVCSINPEPLFDVVNQKLWSCTWHFQISSAMNGPEPLAAKQNPFQPSIHCGRNRCQRRW